MTRATTWMEEWFCPARIFIVCVSCVVYEEGTEIKWVNVCNFSLLHVIHGFHVGYGSAGLKISEERIGVLLVESNEEHDWWNVAYELTLIQGFEKRKYVVNGASCVYTALHNWCCVHIITISTSDVFCVLCSRQINSKMTGASMTLFNSLKKSQVIDHLIGRFHCRAVSRIRGENALCDLLSLWCYCHWIDLLSIQEW